MKRALCLLLTLLLLLAALPVQAESPFYTLGSRVNDFTVTTYDGRTLTLSEVLREKEMVLVNIWASWCGPCRMEFPFMEEAYQQYKDRVEIIAVSCEETDTDAVLADFAAQNGLTFPMARDTANLAYAFYASSIPTTAVIDRFGTVCYLEAGSQTSTEAFTRLFDAFVGDDYTESRLFKGLPGPRPGIPAADPARLAEALDGGLTFTNAQSGYVWPMIPAEEDGRLCLMSTNAGQDSSEAAVYTTVTAGSGDALALTFKTSTEAVQDLLRITVNGETVKVFGGEKEWMTYAHAFDAAGTYQVGFHYMKDSFGAEGRDTVFLDSAVLLTGEDAAAACAENPAYPIAPANTLTLANPDARQIVFDDPTYGLMTLFGLADFYIVPGGTAQIRATLNAVTDPEEAFIVNYYDGEILPITDLMAEDGYALTTPIDSVASTGYAYTNVHLYPGNAEISEVRGLVLFASEADVDAFVRLLPYYGYQVNGWEKVAGEALPEEATYTLAFLDEEGNGVPGVVVNLCSDTACLPLVTDENGMASYTGAPYAYSMQILRAPEGYSFDPNVKTELDPAGGMFSFWLHKE